MLLLSAAWLIVLFGLGLRLLLAGHFLLSPDEANYWQWSRHLAPCYHDHPPLIAWTIRLATHFLGHSEMAVRLPTILGLTIAGAYLLLLARRAFSPLCALQVTLLSQGILLLNGAALIATPDGLLLACWAGVCYHAFVALQEYRRASWLVTGVWFGLGLLAKYTMLLVVPSLFLCLLTNRSQRSLLLRPAPWQALGLGLLIFSPVIAWNAGHDWVTFRHVLYQSGVSEATPFTWKYLFDFLGAQAALVSPLVFLLLLLGAVWRGWRGIPPWVEHQRYLLWMSLPTLLVFCGLALRSRVYGNWPAPAYLSALVLIAALYGPGPDSRLGARRLWRWTVLTAWCMTLPVLGQLLYPLLPLPIRYDRTARETRGWDELARTVHERRQAMDRPGETFIFGLRYQFASELAFYVPGRPETVSINRWTRPNVYDFWQHDEALLGKDAVGIFEGEDMVERVAGVFERAEPAEKIVLRRRSPWFGQEEYASYYLFRGYGFKGGLHWQPRDTGDIRVSRTVAEPDISP